LPTDGKRHRYCQNCLSEEVKDVIIKGKKYYRCDSCGQTHDRLIDIDPQLKWWIDEKTNEYCHESVGMLVIGPDKKILFIERTIFPFGHTIPAGHLEVGEKPDMAVLRELKEETGIIQSEATLFKEELITNDPCRRGADFHFWHLYITKLEGTPKIETDKDEGKNPVWFDLTQALEKKLTSPVRYFLEKYKDEIDNF
jgi:ADP-ribose pyrophosphatase YjhB (NUDIX family)